MDTSPDEGTGGGGTTDLIREQVKGSAQQAQETAGQMAQGAANQALSLAAGQKEQAVQGLQQVSLRTEQGSPLPGETEKVPVPVASPVKQAARIKAAQCAKNQFSCEWPRLSEKVNELKRLFNPQQQQQQQQAAKQKKS